MPILNLSINKQKTRALVCVDTLEPARNTAATMTLGDRESTICPLPYANCILAGRAVRAYVNTLWADIVIGGYGDSFDSIAEHLPARASTVLTNIATQAVEAGVRELGDHFYKPELALIGWSAKRSSIQCLFIRRTRQGFESVAGVDRLCLPCDDSQGRVDISTPEAMIRLAREQEAHDCVVFAELEADQFRIYRRTLRAMN